MGKKNRVKKAPKRKPVPFVERPFEGMAGEVGLVAMREILPAATAPAKTTSEYGDRELTLVTLLPNMASALRRDDGELLVAVQTLTSSGDASRDLADLIIRALELEPGQTISTVELPEPGVRLDEVLVDQAYEPTLYPDFSYWATEEELEKADVQAAIEQTRSQVIPSVQVEGTDGVFWCRMAHEFIRWIRTEDQDAVLNGLARLQARQQSSFDEDAKFVGAFRACGLLIPVWQLAPGTEADELADPIATFAALFDEAISSNEPLTGEERRARSGIVSRQVTLR